MPRDRWKLVAAIALQLAILALVPARQLLAGLRGTEITLATAPVDPFDHFSGPFVALAYEVERPTAPAMVDVQPGQIVYLTVERDEPAWKLVSVDLERPAPVAGRASLRATWRDGRAHIESAGRFYLPQEKATEVERLLVGGGGQRPRALVDMRVDGEGNVALERLRVGGQVFGE